uniref:Retrovirus-related Pol polyprotein from transposon TNT 1-94 n=1 Tax=Tanacetum cinerariifolium TaxID=118510 RepID=A0A699JMQ5_TANCI|nr:hypothetical protein [Tanacetum cinerariifolium]
MTIEATTSNPVKENPVTFQCPESIESAAGVAVDEKKSKMARAFIFQAIPEDILMQVAKKKTARQVWESLKTRFVGADRVQKARLHTFKKKYIHLIASMEQHSDVEEMPFEEAIGRFKVYEDRKAPGGRGRGWNSDRGGRVGTRGVRGSGRGPGDRYGKKSSQEGEHWNRKPHDKSHIKCFECQEFGHFASECRNKKKPEQEVHLMREMEEDTLLLYVKGEHLPSMVMLNENKVFPKLHESQNSSNRDMWYLNNGSSNHMTGDKNLFAELNKSITGWVWFGDGSAVEIKGKASLVDDTWTWHARLGHANFYTLEMIGKKRMVTEMSCVAHPKKLCNGCVVAKQTRQSFPNEAQWRASNPLELVHADLCGPITPQSTGDHGGEFNSQAFVKYCQGEGIQRQTTAPYTPQQNGVVERRNQTVVEMTRLMLKSMNLPDSLWAEAVHHAVYLLNRLPTKAVRDITPYES